jgi:LysR family glycine cleavage system transcriptional activator
MIRNLPPLNAVRAFEAAARHASVSRAAAELGVTPGAVSRQVLALERHLGRTLFRRAAAGLALTEAGETLFAAVAPALERIATAAGAVGRPAGQPAAQALSVGAYTLFASRWLIPRWQGFLARHPGIGIALSTSDHAADLLPERFDAVIAVGDGRAPPGLRAQLLLPIETVPVCSPKLLKDGAFDLSRERLLHSRQRPQDWRRWLAHAGMTGIDADAGLHFESIGLAIEAAAEGQGVALGIRALMERDLAAGRVVIPLPVARPTRRSFVLLHETAREGPALRAFAAWLGEEAARR